MAMPETTRRTFLGTAALTAASYQRILGANDRIGVGFIGYGLIGKQHVVDFKKFTDVDIVGEKGMQKIMQDLSRTVKANQ